MQQADIILFFFQLGILLGAARGAMEIILASVALDAGLIDGRIFAALVFMAVATSMVSATGLRRLTAPAQKTL